MDLSSDSCTGLSKESPFLTDWLGSQAEPNPNLEDSFNRASCWATGRIAFPT